MKNNYTKLTYKTKSEWLDKRGIGGSDLAAICGVSKWKSIDDIYSRLVYSKHIEDNIKITDLMQKGIDAEDHIRKLFELNTDFKVINPPKNKYWLFSRKDYPLMTCTPDGLFKDKNGKLCGLEIKYVDMIKTDIREKWENDVLPDEYYYQCLQYFVVIDKLEAVCLFAYMKYYKYNEETETFDFSYAVNKPYWIFRKDIEAHIKYVFEKEKDFIENNVMTKKRPALILKV